MDGVTIVDCSGRITLGEGSVTLRDAIRELLSKGQKKILLNLGDVNYIDSSGIGELLRHTGEAFQELLELFLWRP
ncbi:anti-sigma factor antagonist [Lacticaseibacillus rhamnosus]